MLSTRGRPSHIPPLPPSFTIHQRPPPSIEHRFLRISTSCPRPLIFASSSHRSSVCQFPHAIELCLFHSIYPRQVPPAKLTFPPVSSKEVGDRWEDEGLGVCRLRFCRLLHPLLHCQTTDQQRHYWCCWWGWCWSPGLRVARLNRQYYEWYGLALSYSIDTGLHVISSDILYITLIPNTYTLISTSGNAELLPCDDDILFVILLLGVNSRWYALGKQNCVD